MDEDSKLGWMLFVEETNRQVVDEKLFAGGLRGLAVAGLKLVPIAALAPRN
jgi:hypothetical protein